MRVVAGVVTFFVPATVLAVFAGILTWGVANAPPGARPQAADVPSPPRYLELLRADPTLVAEIDAAWGEDQRPRPQFDDVLRPHTTMEARVDVRWGTDEAVRRRVSAVVDRDPERSAPAFLAFLIARFGTPDTWTVARDEKWDEFDAWEGLWFRAHAAGATVDAMRRMVVDPSIDDDLRAQLVVALCRPADDKSTAAILDLAFDGSQSSLLRSYARARLPRVGGRPPLRLRELLDVPFRGVSVAAAQTLAAWGDLEAPSLIARAFRRAANTESESDRAACAKALLRCVRDDPVLGPRLEQAAEERWWFTCEGGTDALEKMQRDRKAGFLRCADDVDAWLAAHPKVLETQFERARREYLASERRRHELAYTSLDSVIGSDEFDLAAALLVPGDAKGECGERLEDLDHLARLVRRDVGSNPTPDSWIAAMNHRLLGGPRIFQAPLDPSNLGYVLRVGWGNCMGLSSLYLAVAERLALPIHGVSAPQHVFVRWDDGVVRRNIETTEGGVEHEDRWYVERGAGLAIRGEDVRSGAYLANLSKRTFLALALVNRSYSRLNAGELTAAMECADQAERLAPSNALALLCQAMVTANTRPVDLDDAAAEIRMAESKRRFSSGEAKDAAFVFLRSGFPADALRVADGALEIDPENVDLLMDRVMAMARLGRGEEAGRLMQDVVARFPQRLDVQRADIDGRIAMGDRHWRERLARVVKDPVAEPSVHLDIAIDLLEGFETRPPSPRDAAEVLDCISGLERETDATREKRTGEAVRGHAVQLQRRMYFQLRSLCCHALHDDAGAAAADAEVAKLDAK